MTDSALSKGVCLELDNLTVRLGGQLILDHISATIPQGSSTAVIGPNGAGKTTLILSLLGQIPHDGHIKISPKQSFSSLRIGYVPQQMHFDTGMPLTIMEFMVMGKQRLPLWFGIRKMHRSRALELLDAVGLAHMEKRRVSALSGGEVQRLLLALALGENPDLLVLDEPVSGVDVRGGQVFCELLENLRHQHGFTQLMVSHDLSMVNHHANHVICLNNQKVIAQGNPHEVFTGETLSRLFGPHLGCVGYNSLDKVPHSTHCSSCIHARSKEASHA